MTPEGKPSLAYRGGGMSANCTAVELSASVGGGRRQRDMQQGPTQQCCWFMAIISLRDYNRLMV